jgi:hypothetical protein
MRLPSSGASYRQRIHFGHYVARRLRRAKFADLSNAIVKTTADLREMGRAWEDMTDGLQDALADRDAADDMLDQAAQIARATIAGRSPNAMREATYLAIFPQGIGYFTAATIDNETERYSELKQRLAEHLPADDEVRQSTIPAIEAGLVEYEAAKKAVSDARNAESLARTRLHQATDLWARQVEKTYGALVTELGKSRAGSFFPRARSRSKAGADDASRPSREATEEHDVG